MILFITSILLSAFLLFQVQPLIGKLILPWFGGTSAVWSAILLFFQVLLTGGYAYAYWLIDRMTSRRQAITHMILLCAAFLLVATLAILWPSPITPNSTLASSDFQYPLWNILRVLALSVGLPYFVLTTNSTIIQNWFARVNPGRSPYWLYAVSNAGSLLALISYPLLIEPNFPLITQGWIWATGFSLFTMISIGITLRTWKIKISTNQPAQGQKTSPASHQLLWMALSAAASVLLLATTSRLTQEVAPIPFLWVLPLTVYLLSFVITFSGEGRYRRPIYSSLLGLGSIGIFLINWLADVHLFIQIAVYTFFLFTACTVAHGELFKLRPTAPSLPRFYLLISIGGALGGVAVNLIAPLLFNGYWEFYIGWAGLMMLLTILLIVRKTDIQKPLWRVGHDFIVGVFAFLVLAYSIIAVHYQSTGYLYQERNFYGVSVVYHDEENQAYRFIHGTTVHGLQFIDEEKRDIPTSYYWHQSGITRIIHNHPRYGQGMHVGVLGLGIGTLVAHGQAGDLFRFYEIDPDVVELAAGLEGYFSYHKDSQAEIAIVTGDARISLEKELENGEKQGFDLLVMDAFSSDAVPVHLLTQEAFEIYLHHLSPDGMIAVNITNRYLDLEPVIWLVAQEFGLHVAHFSTKVTANDQAAFYSEWMLLTGNPAILDAPEIIESADFMEGYSTEIRLWTDDFSNLFQILDQ